MKKKADGYQKGMRVLVCSAHLPTSSGVLMPGTVVSKTRTCVEVEFTYRSFFRERTKRMWFFNSDVFGEVEE